VLLAAGADARVRGFDDWTPLHEACHDGSAECVALLIGAVLADGGAGAVQWLNAQDTCGWTALHCACKFSDRAGSASVVELLCATPGVDVGVLDRELSTPLLYACEANCELSAVAALLGAPGGNAASLVNQTSRSGSSALRWAALNRNIDMVRMLLEVEGIAEGAVDELLAS